MMKKSNIWIIKEKHFICVKYKNKKKLNLKFSNLYFSRLLPPVQKVYINLFLQLKYTYSLLK